MKKAVCITLMIAMLTLFTCVHAEVNPQNYLGTWHGGSAYPNGAREYTLTLSRLAGGEIAVDLEVYRINSIHGSMEEYLDENDEAILFMGNGDDQNLLALLTFYPGRMKLDIVEGNVYGLPEDTVIWFE